MSHVILVILAAFHTWCLHRGKLVNGGLGLYSKYLRHFQVRAALQWFVGSYGEARLWIRGFLSDVQVILLRVRNARRAARFLLGYSKFDFWIVNATGWGSRGTTCLRGVLCATCLRLYRNRILLSILCLHLGWEHHVVTLKMQALDKRCVR